MKKNNQKTLWFALCFLAAFALWTAAVRIVDVGAIGPQGSAVGFSAMNAFFHRLTGVHLSAYLLTDWLSLIPFGFVAGFALLGLTQWIQRKSLLKVDFSILVLGGFYLVVLASYTLFEVLIINYRPILIDGVLEASYPSSTTMLVLCVMPTAMMQLRDRIHSASLRRCLLIALSAFTLFMAVGRLVSGVHWLSDIIGGVLLSSALVMLYAFASRLK